MFLTLIDYKNTKEIFLKKLKFEEFNLTSRPSVNHFQFNAPYV